MAELEPWLPQLVMAPMCGHSSSVMSIESMVIGLESDIFGGKFEILAESLGRCELGSESGKMSLTLGFILHPSCRVPFQESF